MKGIVLIVISWLLFTAMAAISKITSESYPIPIIVLFQNGISFLMMIPLLFWEGRSSFKSHHFGLIILRAIFGLIGFAFLLLAVHYTNIVDGMLLYNTSPLFIPFVLLLVKKTPIDNKLWPGIIIGFIGIIFILKPGKELLDLGALYAIGAGILLAIVMVILRMLSHTDHNVTVLFYYFLIASLLILPLSLYYWVAPSAVILLQLISIGLLSGLSQIFFTRSFNYGRASYLGPFNYTGVVFAAIFQWMIWKNIPDVFTWIGIFLVCLGGIFTFILSKPSAPS